MRIFSGVATIGAAGLLALAFAGSGRAEDAARPVAPTNRIDLFNGRDLTGWKAVAKTNADPSQTWRVADGVIKCAGQPNGYLRTEQSCRDYRLTVEWRFVKVAPKANNTGVLMHMQLPDRVWPRCVQCQGQHEKQGDLFLMNGADCKEHQGQGSNVPLPKRGPSNEKAVGEWNTCEMVCAGNTVKACINGKLMNEATGCDVSSGKIGFQSEGGEFEIRKVFLDPIKSL